MKNYVQTFAKSILNSLIIAVGVLLCFLIIRNAYIYHVLYIYPFYPDEIKTKWTNIQKNQVIADSLLNYSVYMMALVILVMFGRIFTGKVDPINQKDNKYILLVNRVLQNSLEQGITFYPLYSYFTLYHCTQQQKPAALMLPLIFLLGRILFLIGYFGTFIQLPTLRSVGFAMSYFPSIICLGYILNVDLLQKMSSITI